MSLRHAKIQFWRNVWKSTLLGFILTLIIAAIARYSPYAWRLMPYGIDDPVAPTLYIIRNSFWIFIVLLAISVFTRERNKATEALPMFLLNIQVFVGEAIVVFLAAGWRALSLPHEDSLVVLLTLTFAGQVLAYLARKKLSVSRS